jgi:hypothetical protein
VCWDDCRGGWMDVWMVFSVLGLIGKKTSQLAKRSYSIGKKNSFILIGKKNLSIGKKILFNWQKNHSLSSKTKYKFIKMKKKWMPHCSMINHIVHY